jgi:hypothetical protein
MNELNLKKGDIILVPAERMGEKPYYKVAEFHFYNSRKNMVFALNALDPNYGCFYNRWGKII